LLQPVTPSVSVGYLPIDQGLDAFEISSISMSFSRPTKSVKQHHLCPSVENRISPDERGRARIRGEEYGQTSGHRGGSQEGNELWAVHQQLQNALTGLS
jgi:hypothetical protein